MKFIRNALLMSVMLWLPMLAQAQISDKLMLHTGFMWEFLPTETLPSSNYGEVVLPNFYTFGFGGYYLFGHRNDVVSYGVDATAQVGVNFATDISGRLPVNFLGQTPVYLSMRFGALSTPYNTQRVGLALGVGGNFNYVNTIGRASNAFTKINGTFVSPQVMGQITFVGRGSALTGRIHLPISSVQSMLNFPDAPSNQESPYSVSSFGLGLVYGF